MSAFSELLACLRVSEYELRKNAQIKEYPDGSAVVTVFDRCIIREAGYEAAGGPQKRPQPEDEAQPHPEATEADKAANLARAKRRARSAVFDIAKATDFEFFATFTIDPDRVADRMDDEEVFRHLHYWLGNNVSRRGLAYVLVPEYHKRGGLHFHALINGALEVVDSGTISLPGGGKPRRPRSKAQRAEWLAAGGQPVYNLPGWGFGFSTAIRLYGDREAAIGYVTKYITKSEAKIGGRWYYSGGELKRPFVSCIMADWNTAAALGKPFEIEELGAHGVRLTLSKEEYHETVENLRRPVPPVWDRPEEGQVGDVLL